MVDPHFIYLGDTSFLVRLGDEISEEINRIVRALVLSLEKEPIEGIVEVVPTYRSVMIDFEPTLLHPKRLAELLDERIKKLSEVKLPPPRIIEVPTVYGGKFGPDIEFVAKYNNLTVDEVIELHSKPNYLVYMLGFAPGFTYLGGLDERLWTPRLKNPRTKVPAGSVGIGGKQTGVYAIETPGGWRIIGRTYLKIYDPQRDPPVMVRVGDYLKFVPITEEEFFKNYKGEVDYPEEVTEE